MHRVDPAVVPADPDRRRVDHVPRACRLDARPLRHAGAVVSADPNFTLPVPMPTWRTLTDAEFNALVTRAERAEAMVDRLLGILERTAGDGP